MLSDTYSPAQTEQNVGLIFLVGFMGCGKTTLGRKLANRLGYQFIDLDHAFEDQEGTTIIEYFAQHGEEKFREMESALLKQTEYPANAIISTGGGLPCFFDNMDWMNSHGRTFYVKLSPKTLADRLDNGKTTRPVLQGKHGDELVALIEERLAAREPFYSQATFVVEGLNLNSEKSGADYCELFGVEEIGFFMKSGGLVRFPPNGRVQGGVSPALR